MYQTALKQGVMKGGNESDLIAVSLAAMVCFLRLIPIQELYSLVLQRRIAKRSAWARSGVTGWLRLKRRRWRYLEITGIGHEKVLGHTHFESVSWKSNSTI